MPASLSQLPGLSTYTRVTGLNLDEEDRAFLRQRLDMKLAKFASSIARVSIRVDDVNGPRGGVDRQCRIKVVLTGLPTVVVENHARTARTAIHSALTAAERAVRRAVRRRRAKPMKAVRAPWHERR